MSRFALFLAALLAVAVPAMAAADDALSTLTASGEGKVQVRPDVAIVTLGVISEAASAKAALAANSSDMTNVTAAIRAAGVADADIATSGFSVSPVYSQQRPRQDGIEPAQTITGYRVSNQVTVRIRDIDQSGTVLDRVVSAGANRISGIAFDIAEPERAKDDAVRRAVGEARRKADLIAEASGVRILGVRSVTVSESGQSGPEIRAFAAAAVPISAGQRAVTANATIVFEIGPR
jgi:uncharacterized protein YggE